MTRNSASNVRPSSNYSTKSHGQIQQLILYRVALVECSASGLTSFYDINNRNFYVYLEISIIWPWMAWMVLSKKKKKLCQELFFIAGRYRLPAEWIWLLLFYVLLTRHLGTIFVNNQLDARQASHSYSFKYNCNNFGVWSLI